MGSSSVKATPIILLILLILIYSLPAFSLSQEKIINPYNCINLAAIEKSLIAGKITSITMGDFHYDPYDQGHLGYEAIVMIVIEISGLSAKEAAVLPVGGIIVPFIFFALSKKIFNSNILAAFFAIFIAYDPSLSPSQYNIFAYTWERLLFFIFIILTMRILEKGKNPVDVLLLILIFVGTFSIYWTTPALMILFLAGINLLLLIQMWVDKSKELKRKLTLRAVLIFSIIFLGFNKLLYNDYLPSVVHEKYGTTADAFNQLLTWISMRQSITEEYSVATSSGNQIYDWILVFRYIIMLIPIISYLVVKLISVFREQKLKLNLDTYSYLMWPIILAGLAQNVVYAARGHLSFRYISILFLPLTVISLDRLKAKRLKVLTLSILLLLVFSGFSFLLLGGFFGHNKTSNIETSAHFLFNRSNYNAEILTDLNTFGIYLLESVFYKKPLSIRSYNSDNYGMIVEKNYSSVKNNLKDIFDYVIINKVLANNPTAAPNWKYYEPLSKYFMQINNNVNINKIYDNGNIWIFKT